MLTGISPMLERQPADLPSRQLEIAVDTMLKAVGVALSLAVLCGAIVAVASGEYAILVALVVAICGASIYRKLLQLERRIQTLEEHSSGDSSEPPEPK